MPGNPLTYVLPYFGMILLTDAVIIYAVYLALSVWRGLAVPTYKGRALWTGLLATLVLVAFTDAGILHAFFPQVPTGLVQTGSNFAQTGSISATGAGTDLAFFLLGLAAFAWVDKTMATIIRLDFLRRDVLGWKKFRPAYWAMITASFAGYFGTYFLLPSLGHVPPQFSLGLLAVLLILPLVYASLLLPIGARRTRDATFRSHARWLGYFLATFLLIGVLYFAGVDPFYVSFVFLATSYCLYKMARYLVPSTKFPGG